MAFEEGFLSFLLLGGETFSSLCDRKLGVRSSRSVGRKKAKQTDSLTALTEESSATTFSVPLLTTSDILAPGIQPWLLPSGFEISSLGPDSTVDDCCWPPRLSISEP